MILLFQFMGVGTNSQDAKLKKLFQKLQKIVSYVDKAMISKIEFQSDMKWRLILKLFILQ